LFRGIFFIRFEPFQNPVSFGKASKVHLNDKLPIFIVKAYQDRARNSKYHPFFIQIFGEIALIF
jgi:hypothetical protein